jgi:hypothetical protein
VLQKDMLVDEKDPLQLPFYKDLTDKRYDAFIASILKPISGDSHFIDGLNILTWTYDYQFELACKNYGLYSDRASTNRIQSIPSIDNVDIPFNGNLLSIIHLNGIAYSSFVDIYATEEHAFYNNLIRLFNNLFPEGKERTYGSPTFVSFAWENLESDFKLKVTPIFEAAFSVSSLTEYLVICGYSFPIFNRAIDIQLLQSMKNLKGIFLQSPAAEGLKALLAPIVINLIPQDAIVDVGYWNQFYVPDLLLT